ncbi:MAG: cytochrome c biogenesis protein CcsA, partial [Acidimicrobiia bacterium]|nr:cytochrome c biogenesis protein CcsA [Acidimicrobiia bacterium]
VIGWSASIALAVALVFGLWLSPDEVTQGDAVRLMYLHLPTIAVAYLGFGITFLGSIVYLRNRSVFWDLMAGAAAEIGVLFTALLLITGALWGKPTWGTYWEWDPRLTSTAVMFIMYLGYLAVRRLELPQEVRSRRAAVLGIIGIANVVIVHYSVQWWRGLHQGQSIGVDTKIEGLMLFTLFLSVVAFILVGAWLLIHRFRVAWLERQVEDLRLARALAERRSESGGGAEAIGGRA